MLGINLLFAGFALTLNGVSYITKVDDKVKGVANVLVGLVIAINAIFQAANATDHITFGFSAAMWLFAINYFIIAAHIFFGSTNWKVFGLYGLFAGIVSFVFMGDTLVNGGPWEMVYMWAMWGALWAQSFLAILCGSKAVDKLTPHILILNGIASTFIPGFLILLGVIL
ncbi:MAG: AmiS/UreI family transporter [Defluviitaleaceae bacterium]|nr:AmiS/UreI family transporter [Defluviitaleaceae bacterium]